MSSQGNSAIPLNVTELDEIIKKLPSFETYKEVDTTKDSTSYSDKCNDLGTTDDQFKKLCEKFMKNIEKLKEHENNLTKLKVHSSSLGYWIIDELRKYFTDNDKNIDRGLIDKLIIELNKISHESISKRLFFNSNFDFNLSREEKFLHDYFKNYNTIVSCKDKNCADYYKYVSYIEEIYYKHREDCLGNVCDYFNFHDKYDPENLLSKLKGLIQGFNKEKENKGSWLGTEGEVSKDSKQKPRMVIKYMLCTKIFDKDKDIHGYYCEDPAYRHNSDRARFIKNIKKKQETSEIEVNDPLNSTDDSRCKKTSEKGQKTRIHCESLVPLKQVKGGPLTKKDEKVENLEGKPENSPVSTTQTVQFVNSNVNFEEYEDRDNFVPRVRFYSLNRELPYFEIKSDNTAEKRSPKLPTSKVVTLFPEFVDEDRENYKDKDIPKCEIYTRVRGKLACKKTIDGNYNEKSASSGYPVNSSGEDEIEKMDELESSSAPDGFFSILRSSKFRTGTMTFLTFGFTPLGDWLSRKLFKKKKVNNYIYEEPMPKQEERPSRPPNGSQKSKRIRIAYQSN
ncbi:VIR protein [Plasmodium vivax]|uniref:VIR protein n=1 Tax=Plasmodium vivax TaxID=5855 RepID=A0A1G4H3Z7_PLAVI|nr:VIR protein [Plasmodium vivax]